MSFQYCRMQNTCLCKCLKSHVEVERRTVNMLKCPKRYCNLLVSSFIGFVHRSGKVLLGKSLS